MDFQEARTTLQSIVDQAGEQELASVPVATLKDMLAGFDNDEQVLIMHNTAVALLLKLGGRAEVKAEDALQIHRSHTMQFGKLPEGIMVLQAVDKAKQN